MLAHVIKLVAFIGFALFLGGMVTYVSSRQDTEAFIRLQKNAEALRQGNQALLEQNIKLKKAIDGLKTNPIVVEKKIREDLKYVRPDEILFVFP